MIWRRAATFYLLLFVGVATGRRLDAAELLIGDWDISLRCGTRCFSSELFPPLSAPASHSVLVKKRQKRISHLCHLKIYSNGTFSLSPKVETLSFQNRNLLLLRGRWTIHPNPYCVTDRFYDELVLKSYSRLQKQVTLEEEKIVNEGSFHMQCRLFGHFSAGRISRRFRSNTGSWYAKGRLCRGTLFWNDGMATNQGRVRGSFAGHRFIFST
jgi:hypothetical protein